MSADDDCARLEAEVERLTREHVSVMQSVRVMQNERVVLRAENERLRAALADALRALDALHKSPILATAAENARAALAGGVGDAAAPRLCMVCGKPTNVSVCDRCCE